MSLVLQYWGRANTESGNQVFLKEWIEQSVMCEPPSSNFRGVRFQSLLDQYQLQPNIPSFDHFSQTVSTIFSSPMKEASASQSGLRMPQPWAESQQKQHWLFWGKAIHRLLLTAYWMQEVETLGRTCPQKVLYLPLTLSTLSLLWRGSQKTCPLIQQLVPLTMKISSKVVWQEKLQTGGLTAKPRATMQTSSRKILIFIYYKSINSVSYNTK